MDLLSRDTPFGPVNIQILRVVASKFWSAAPHFDLLFELENLSSTEGRGQTDRALYRVTTLTRAGLRRCR